MTTAGRAVRAVATPAPGGRLPRGRHGLTREEVGASQRGRMMEAIARAVAANGYANTTVSGVAMRAGVSTRAFYEQFSGKEECFLSAFDAAVGQILERIRDALDGLEGSPLSKLDHAIEVYLETLAVEPELAQAFLIEAYGVGPRALERRAATQAAFAEQLGALLEEAGSEPGHVPPPPLAGEALVGAIAALVTNRIAAGAAPRLLDLHLPIFELARRLVGERRALGVPA